MNKHGSKMSKGRKKKNFGAAEVDEDVRIAVTLAIERFKKNDNQTGRYFRQSLLSYMCATVEQKRAFKRSTTVHGSRKRFDKFLCKTTLRKNPGFFVYVFEMRLKTKTFFETQDLIFENVI